ncbi:hypothetical protein BJ085DRAFT_10126, partial [Dimargaris cristalligena]
QIWVISRYIKNDHLQYAVKVALSLTAVCLPAWFDSSMHFFQAQRMQWITVVTFIVLSPTIGRTLLMSIYRVLGTLY